MEKAVTGVECFELKVGREGEVSGKVKRRGNSCTFVDLPLNVRAFHSITLPAESSLHSILSWTFIRMTPQAVYIPFLARLRMGEISSCCYTS